MTPFSTRRGLAAAAAVISLAAIGCGSSSSSSNGNGNPVHAVNAAFILRSAASSAAQAGYKMTMTVHFSVAGMTLNMTGQGAFDAKDRTGSMSISMPLNGLPAAASATLGGSTLQLQEVLDGTTIYMRFPPALASKLPGGKSWLSLDLTKLAGSAGVSGISSLLSNPTSSNPAAFLQYLGNVAGNVQSQGGQTINGVPTTLYTGTIDVSKESALAAPSQRAAVKQALAALSKMAGLKRIPVNVWIDANGLVRQIGITIDENIAAAGQVTMQMLIGFPSYGVQPKPTIPPASDVTDMSQVLGSGLAHLGG